MKKLTKINKFFVLLVSILMLSLTLAIFSIKTPVVKASGTFEMVEGASIRLGNENESGIRFVAQIPDNTDKDYKVLIVYKEMLTGIENKDIIAGLIDKYDEEIKDLTIANFANYFTVVEDIIPVEDAEYGWVVKGSIVCLPENTFSDEFIGIAYYEEAGARVYANYKLSNARSIATVAKNSLADSNASWSADNKETLLSYIGEYENDIFAYTNTLLDSTVYFGGKYKTTIQSQVIEYEGNSDGITVPSGLSNSNTFVKQTIKGKEAGQFFGGVPIWFDSETNPLFADLKTIFEDPTNTNIYIGFYMMNKSRFNVNVALLGADNVGGHFNDGNNDHGFKWDLSPTQGWEYFEFPLAELNVDVNGAYKFGIGISHWDENATTSTSEDCIYIDGLTLVNKPRGVEFSAGVDKNIEKVFTASTKMSFEYKLKTEGKMAIALMNGSNWDNYYGYYEFDKDGAMSSYAGITTEKLVDGYVRVYVDFALLNRTGNNNNRDLAPNADVNLLYVRGAWTTADGYIDNVTDITTAPDHPPVEDETEYNLSYNLNGGFVDNPSTYTAQDEFILHNPIKEGKSFAGWTYDGQEVPQLKVKISKGTTGDKNFVANFVDYNFEQLKVAIFADIQLRTDNQGSTANAYLALKDHFNYAKSINADVLLMSGDIINNAVKEYYDLFMTTFKEVYGNDESAYPEFVMNMGNHEWWDNNEHETKEAVSLFKDYVRIESENIVRQSKIKYYLDDSETLPSYYKVIKGVPFLVVSGEKSNGQIGSGLKAEIDTWLTEISKLPSVKNGGPIYVSYHYPIPNVTYKGEHTEESYGTIDTILKNYPNAIVFTGDTHFNGVNERTINQVDYTSINIGTSSYSRSISESATGFKYNNVDKGVGKSGAGKMLGDINFKYEYTPTIMVATMDNATQTKIDRYYTAKNLLDITHIGKTWIIPQITNKSAFTYTNSRIQNTNSAVELYGKTGLDWASGEVVRFNVDGANMFINFNDVIDYNCAEHYRIEVKDTNNASNVKYYDFMSHYYKYDASAHAYNFVLENIPSATNYTVTVTAYDFFDNISTNTLQSTIDDNTLVFPDDIDLQTLNTYSDISMRVNYDVKADGSNSSVEYYYKGVREYKYGMILDRVILKDGKSLNEYLSVNDWSNTVVTFKVKNNNNYAIEFSPTVVLKIDGKEQWLTDGGAEYKVRVDANSEWTTVSWNLKDSFNITSDTLYHLSIKAFVPKSAIDTENGYEVNFFIDDIDVIEN